MMHTLRKGSFSMREDFCPPFAHDIIRDVVYRNIHLIGKGGFSSCYKFVETSGQNKVHAIKVIDKRYLKHRKQMLSNEINIHVSLKHPHIVDMSHYFEDCVNIYFCMEYCPGGSLVDLLAKETRLSIEETLNIAMQIIKALVYIHHNFIIHRDIKLSNIVIVENRIVKITDFGMAVRMNNNTRYSLCGTKDYIAPEIIAQTGYSFPVDMWSFGCVLFALMTGSLPRWPNPIEETIFSIPEVDELLKCLMDPVPGRRQTADQFEASLSEFLAETYIQ